MFDEDGMRLNLVEEGKGFCYMVAREEEKVWGLKMKL